MRRLLLTALIILLLVGIPLARPYKSPTVDGTITGDGSDWDPDDLAVDDPIGDTIWDINEIDDLWVTYDADFLYIGIRYQVNNNAMLVLLDTKPGVGASDINGIDWYARNFNFPDSLTADLMIANWNGGNPEVRRVLDNSTTADISSGCLIANTAKGAFFYEAEIAVPWDSIYGLGDGQVQPSARVKTVTFIAGGDNWGGPDSAPDNPGVDGGGGPILLSNWHTKIVDPNGDGIPDGFDGSIEGTISLEDPLDTESVIGVELYSEATGTLVDEAETLPGGGTYRFERLPDGSYRVEAFATGYARIKEPGVVISGQNEVSGVDILLTLAGKITGTVGFADGPGYEGTVTAYDSTGGIAGEGPLDFPATGGDFELLLPGGPYTIIAEARGYIPDTLTAIITDNDSIHAGTLDLYAVRATRLVLVEHSDGEEIESVSTTVSYPDSNIYFYAVPYIEARDDNGRRDWYNLDGHLDYVDLRATKLNNITPPRGNVRFAIPDGGLETVIDTTTIGIYDGIGAFLVADDEIEVLRIFTETRTGGIAGRFKVGIRSAEPQYIELSSSAPTITADGSEEITISGRLLDISKNPVNIAGLPVTFSLAPTSTGAGTFSIPSAVTSADGEVTTTLSATVAGTIHITASAEYLNRPLIVLGDPDEEYVAVDVLPGDPYAVKVSTGSDIVGYSESLMIRTQLVDQFGNNVSLAGYTVTFTHTPPSAGTITQPLVTLDGSGYGETEFVAGAQRAVVSVTGVPAPALEINDVAFEIDDIMTISDPAYPEPDAAHSSLEAMDLTTVLVSNTSEYIDFRVKFDTNFDGAHLVILIETGGDAAGASDDPFLFPVSYGHDLRPDYALTYKYSSDDYGDMRRWSGTEWEWWDDEGKQYISTSTGEWTAGIDIHTTWITRGDEYVNYRIPFDFFEGVFPSEIRFEVYLTQEAETKRSAFDSAPHDSTLDIDFDPDNPEADWSVTEAPVTLREWSDVYAVTTVFPDPPLLSNLASDPATVDAGGMVTFSTDVTDAGDGIGAVLIDLSPVGGSRFQFLYDTGTNGDETAGDGKYSYLFILDPGIAGGEYTLAVTAKDSENISRTDSTLTLGVEGVTTAIRTITDELNDDFGPNQFGREGLYYIYPSNIVFVQRAFDLEEVVIYETSNIVGGEIIPSYAFQVSIGNLPDPADEGTADWNPHYADINIQKVDIYIDAFKGGATEGLPNRQNDFTRWDAWDYAIIMEGWYKGVIASNNQNTPLAWANNVRKTDRDIVLISDFENNTITAIVSKESLGNPTAEDIQNWDMMILMTSHDGHSDDNNFGDTRWVNSSPSEWNFGGGGDLDRDSNIIDLIASPGLGHSAGRPQGELLDYKTDEAVARLENGETAVLLEMSAFEDQGPPVIDIGQISDETVRVTALRHAPLYFPVTISDDDDVESAVFRWRPDSTMSDTWTEEIPMGYAGNDIWSVDLSVEDILAFVPIAEFDSTGNIEFQIEASDPSGNSAMTPLYTMEIPQPVSSYEVIDIDMNEDLELRAPEGTFVRIASSAIPSGALDVPFLFSLSPRPDDDFPLPASPAASIGIIRTIDFEAMMATIDLETGDTLATTIPVPEFDEPVSISLHYPQFSVAGLDEDLLGVYEFNETTQTWIYIGGTVNPFGNLVTVSVMKPGTYAIFYNPDFSFDPGEELSGIVFSPNPFSPNGDGLYEETNISFYLSKEATITIEIYDMDGNRKRILEKRVSFTAEDTPDAKPRRITGITWDGKDNTGVTVSYGIYIARFTVTFQQAAGQRTIRKNAAVAVIK